MSAKQFDSELHETLFALFILKANSLAYETYTNFYRDDVESFMYFMNFHYADLFSDRAICEPEHEGWTLASEKGWQRKGDATMVVRSYNSYPGSSKIKFYFVEDE